jgi:unsaturated rhamnogalacturonyl hydrolase
MLPDWEKTKKYTYINTKTNDFPAKPLFFSYFIGEQQSISFKGVLIMKPRNPILLIAFICFFGQQSFALTEFDADSIVNVMKRLAKYRITRPYNQISNNWDGGAYLTGVMALYYSTQDTSYLNFAKQWSQNYNWTPWSGVNTVNADNICCTQTYSEIFLLNPIASNNFMINQTKQNLTNFFDVRKITPPYLDQVGWWWCDALYMAPPAIVRYVKASNEPRFLDSLDRYWWSVSSFLYDTTYHFYYRDKGFFFDLNGAVDYKHARNGKPVFWSCGEAWVIGGLARVLDYMPSNYPTRPKWEKQFKDMCAAIKTEQGFNNTAYDGLWTTSMLDHPDYPYPETSGSAFFCFAMAWGVRNKLLDSATYTPCINKAWRDLVKNIGADGRLLRCQHIDWMPRQDLSGDQNNSSPEGEGAFLLAGYEMYLRAKGASAVLPTAAIVKKNAEALIVHGTVVSLRLENPAVASMKIFAADGRLALDLSSRVRQMRQGTNTLSLTGLCLAPGVYRVVMNNGNGVMSARLPVVK